VLDYRPYLLAVDQLRHRCTPVSNKAGNLLDGHASIGQERHEAVP
jgi:hypothetical protein